MEFIVLSFYLSMGFFLKCIYISIYLFIYNLKAEIKAETFIYVTFYEIICTYISFQYHIWCMKRHNTFIY